LDWFFHDPGQGRVGPLSPEEMRNRYRERRIQLDTLVWREGMREWQPLERMSEELDLLSVRPDARLPPPLPPGTASPATFHTPPGMAAPMGNGPLRAAPPRKGMSGCLIALIVCAVVAVPVIAILAAIAVPAYQQYVIRSKVVMQIDARAPVIEAAVQQAMAGSGRCPASAEALGLDEAAARDVDFGNVAGRCAFRMTVRGVRPQVDGKSVVFIAPASPGGAWDCTGGDLPAKFRSPQCRPEGEPTP
jgi:type IV pilus assembly protein PilA